MDRLDIERGDVAASPTSHVSVKATPIAYTLPSQYNRANRYVIDGQSKAFKGRRALMLDLLDKAKSAGIGRADTWQAIGNPADVVAALKRAGVQIQTQKRQAKCYFLLSNVKRIGGAA